MKYLLFILALFLPATALAQAVVNHVTIPPVIEYDGSGTALADATNHALRVECISNTCGGGGGGTVNQGTGASSTPWYMLPASGANFAQETGGNLASILTTLNSQLTTLNSQLTALTTLANAVNNPIAAQTGNGVLIGATQGMETGGTGTTANKVGIQGCSTCVPVPMTGSVAALLGTTNGWTPQRLSALSTTVVSIKTSAGQLGMLQCYNPNSSQAYVQIFNVASGSVTLGTTSPTLSIPIAPLSTGGYALPNPGINFSTAIAIAATTTAAGSTANSTAVDCNVAFN